MIESAYREQRQKIEQRIAEICRSVAAGQLTTRDARPILRDLGEKLRLARRAERREARKRERGGRPQLALDFSRRR